jgi:hypothetical protein
MNPAPPLAGPISAADALDPARPKATRVAAISAASSVYRGT